MLGRRGSSNDYKVLNKKLDPLIKAAKSLKEAMSISNNKPQSEIQLCLETIVTFSAKDKKMKNFHSTILALIKSLTSDENATIMKLSPLEAAALRKKCNLSVSQIETIRRFLQTLEVKIKNNPSDPRQGIQLNPFIIYDQYHKCDIEAMPSNCHFQLIDKVTGIVVEDHQATVEGGGVYSVTEDYDKYGSSLSEDPKPAILGTYMDLREVVANELKHMAKLIIANLPEGEKGSEEPFHLLVALACGADGISGVTEIKSNERYHLPSKVFVSSLRILNITTKEEPLHIIYRNPKPNSPNQLPLVNVVADESDNWAIRSIYLKQESDIKDLRTYNMKILQFICSFKLFYMADGKLRVRQLQTGGATHTCNCNICEARRTDTLDRAKLRTISEMEKLSVRAQWNPQKKDMSQLYEESKGCNQPPLCPELFFHLPHCIDELHMLLNFLDYYEKAFIKILAYCHENDQVPCKELFERGRSTEHMVLATCQYEDIMKLLLKKSSSVAEKRQQPGNYAR